VECMVALPGQLFTNTQISEQFAEGARLEAEIRKNLLGLSYGL
jgi:hypothetical protein